LEFEQTVRMTIQWYKVFYERVERSTFDFTSSQINEYTDLANSKNIYWATE